MTKIRRTTIGGSTAIALAVALVGCGAGETPEESKTLVIGEIGGAQSFSPYGAFAFTSGGQAIYDFLVSIEGADDERGTVEVNPLLATEWEFNEDATSLVFDIRDDVRFVSGAALDATAVKANFDWALETDQFFMGATGATEVAVLDGNRVELTLTGAVSPYKVLSLIAVTGFADPAAIEADPDGLSENPAGSGPYTWDPDRSTAEVQYTYVRNDDHWNVDAYPYETIVVKKFSDVVAAANALKTGQVDVASIDATTAADVEQAGFVLHESNTGWVGLYFNDRAGEIVPAIGDVRVRQAMNMAFDRASILENLEQGFARASTQIWGSGWPEFDPDLDERYPYDPEAARELLAEAGYPDGFDLVIPSGDPYFARYEPIVQQSLTDIGIRVTFEVSLPDEIFAKITERPTRYAVTFAGDGFDDSLAYRVPADGLFNTGTLVDPLAEELAHTVAFGDSAASADAAARLGAHLVDEAWAVVLSHPSTIVAHHPDVEMTEASTSPYPHWKFFRPAE
jgi:peptide/nickel transport system substrate-binding protein